MRILLPYASGLLAPDNGILQRLSDWLQGGGGVECRAGGKVKWGTEHHLQVRQATPVGIEHSLRCHSLVRPAAQATFWTASLAVHAGDRSLGTAYLPRYPRPDVPGCLGLLSICQVVLV